MEILEAIKIALPIFAEHKDSDWDALQTALKSSNIPITLASRLIEFMPLAYGRVFLDGMGVKFEDYFIRMQVPYVQERKIRLIDHSVYSECLLSAKHIVESNSAGEAFLAVAWRSAEMHVVNDALLNGSKPENLVMSPPILQWLDRDEFENIDNSESSISNPKNSWWKIWKRK